MNAPIFIMGMHRSGTTLLAAMLRSLGVFMGAARDKNEESPLVLFANEQLLRAHGASWDNPVSFSCAMRDATARQQAVQALESSLRTPSLLVQWAGQDITQIHEADIQAPIGFKDPRFVYTLPIWLHLFPQAKIISIRRHGVDVAASLHTRQTSLVKAYRERYRLGRLPAATRFVTGLVEHSLRCLHLEECLALWEEYCLQEDAMLARGSEGQVLRLCYEELLHYPQVVMEHVADFLELNKVEAVAVASGMVQPQQALKYQHEPELMKLAKRHKTLLAAFGYKP